MSGITRRDFAKLSFTAAAGTAAGTAAIGASLAPKPVAAARAGRAARKAELPAAKGQRAVIVGGGWSGLTIAKYLKKNAPELDVVLIEKRSTFVSHPLSNLWLGGLTSLENLAYSYLDAAKNNDYVYFNATLVDVDRVARRLVTDQGSVDYDYLVLAPGVEYDYASFGVKDPAAIQALKTKYPGGFVSGSEHISIKNKIENFTGGIFVLTAPPGIYRCSASPFERACIIAAAFKRRKIKGKVVMIDPRERPPVKPEGFLAAFEELYGDHIEYMNSTVIEKIDPETRTITTDFDEITFDDAAIYPRIRAARLIEDLGLADSRNPQKEARIDNFKYNIIGDERVYVTGDCRPMPFSKSASVAHTEGIYVAELIAARTRGKDVAWRTPESICYSMVAPEAREAILSRSLYRFDAPTRQWAFAEGSRAFNQRDQAMGRATFKWGDDHFRDLFS